MLQGWVLNQSKYHTNQDSEVKLLAFGLDDRIPHHEFTHFYKKVN